VRIVLCCWGSFGDLFPYVSIGRQLKAMGHDPVIATCPMYREMVSDLGLGFAPVRPDVDPDNTDIIRRVMDHRRGTEVVVKELLVPARREAHADTLAAARGADVLVSHPVTFAAPIVAEQLKRPWLSTTLAPVSFFSRFDFPILPPYTGIAKAIRRSPWLAGQFMKLARAITTPWTKPVQDLRVELGLPAGGNPLYEGQFSPYGTLALYSRVMGGAQPDWPVKTQLTGFCFNEEDGAMPPEVSAFLDAGDPPIVFTLGSSAVGAPGAFYDESVRAAQAIGRRALLLVGRDEVARARSLPAGMLAAGYVPHRLVFPRAAAVVHHGGVGTTGQGLRAGVPMLVVPHAHDQPDNAFRVERLGLAKSLDAKQYRAEAAAPLLKTLLDDPGFARRARAVSEVVRSESGAVAAANAIETCRA
jgi:rhamnosyltransferase subunit B